MQLQPLIVTEKFKTAAVGGKDGNGYSTSQRPCPKCMKKGVKYLLQTNRAGAFRCENTGCGYADFKDTSKYRHLKYRSTRMSTFVYGNKKQRMIGADNG